jgi:hypothetical protein
MHWVDALGYAAALSTFATFWMRTMIPLRITGIAANFFFIGYGYFGGLFPVFFLHLALLPLNVVRLYQMVQLIRKVKDASSGDLSLEWFKSFMATRQYRKGDVLFRKGDVADEMLLTVSGEFRLVELGLSLGAGEVVGEIGIVTPDNRRTQTIECIADGEVLTISYDRVRELYFQNPKFGFYLLRLIGERLTRNIARLEPKHPTAISET